jgi:hypothetical protein
MPTRSQIEAYTTDHLVDAADHWDGLADRWEDAHWQVRNQAHALDWQGLAGDALQARTASDYVVAADHADLLRVRALRHFGLFFLVKSVFRDGCTRLGSPGIFG